MTASLNKKWFKEEMGNSVEHEQGKQDSQKPGAKLSAQYDSWWAIDKTNEWGDKSSRFRLVT